MSKKPQKSSPASRHTSNGNGGATEKAAAPAQSQNGKRSHQQSEQVADDNLDELTDQLVSSPTTTKSTAKMTNENHEQPQIVNNVARGAPPPTPLNQRPDRKRCRPTAANAQEQKVIVQGELVEQVVQETKSMARQRNRLQSSAAREQVSATDARSTTPAAGPHPVGAQNICAACGKPIRERYLLMALDKHWHEDCLKCACCDCRLGEVGSSLFTHSDKLLCKRDFLRIFGQHGHCAVCKRSIPPYEMVMRANEHAYHMDCFACQQCQYRFCVGDRYHLTETHKIVCLLCHNETQQAQTQDTNLQQEQSNTRQPQSQPRGPTTDSNPPGSHITVQPANTSPDGGGHLSPDDDDDHKPPPPSQESMGDTSGSQPEVSTEPAIGQRVAENGGNSATRPGQLSPSGHDFVELTNQRTATMGPTIKREHLEEGPGSVGSSTANKKRPVAPGPPHPHTTANVTTAATTAGCVM